MASDFSDLLQRAEQLTSDFEMGNDRPRIERNLNQLAEAGQRLWSKTNVLSTEGAGTDASLLLSSKGVEVPKLSSRLAQLTSFKALEPLEPIADADIHGFLKNERQNALLSAIEDNKKSTIENAERHFWQSMESEWEVEKKKILNSLVSSSKAPLSFAIDNEIIERGILGQGRSAMTTTEMAYARQVYICNEADIHNKQYNIYDVYKQVYDSGDNTNARETWQLFRLLTENSPQTNKSASETRSSQEFQSSIVQNARSHLESRYTKYVENIVYSNLQQAQLGGVPGTYNLVKSFLKIKFPVYGQFLEDGDVDGIPIWPLIYFCFRCGDNSATTQAAEALPPQFSDFKSCLREYLTNDDRRLSPNAEAKVRLEYKRSVRSCADPFKRVIYCLLGCCDSSDTHPEVVTKTEDYIWLKLHQVGFDDEDTQSQNRSTLGSLQSLLCEEYGEVHFKAYQQPFLYCQVLFLTGQFEAGIEFLSRIEQHRCHGVHFAIVLHYKGLLLMPDSIHTHLLLTDPADPQPMRRLNFAKLLTHYTNKFESTDPREAIEYFYLLRNVKEADGRSLFSTCISDLVLETREFETILGRLNADGSRKPGCVEKFNIDTLKIICCVGDDAERKGHFEEAASLFDLAARHDKVLDILNRLLCQLTPLPSAPHSSRERLQSISRSIAARYKERGCKASPSSSSTFYLLLDVMYFFDLYHQRQIENALDVIRKIKLLPFRCEDVEQRVTAFNQYSDEIRQCLPDILLATMTTLHTLHKNYRTNSSTVPDLNKKKQESYLDGLKQQARALITFVGLLPYRMPGDTNARLMQLEVMMT